MVEAVRAVAVAEEAVVADEGRGVAACLITTLGRPGLRARRSCSFTSSAANASSFSRFDFSDSRRPRNSSASTFRCVSILSAAATAFFASSELSAFFPEHAGDAAWSEIDTVDDKMFVTFCEDEFSRLGWMNVGKKVKKENKQWRSNLVTLALTHLDTNVVAPARVPERHGH